MTFKLVLRWSRCRLPCQWVSSRVGRYSRIVSAIAHWTSRSTGSSPSRYGSMTQSAPRIRAAWCASSTLMRAYSSGDKLPWPFSPGVMWTSTARQPAATCLKMVAPPMISASAAWAPTTMMQLASFVICPCGVTFSSRRTCGPHGIRIGRISERRCRRSTETRRRDSRASASRPARSTRPIPRLRSAGLTPNGPKRSARCCA